MPLLAIAVGVSMAVAASAVVLAVGDRGSGADGEESASTSVGASEKGPTSFEWEVIGVYKAIESMTADDPTPDVVDATLDQLEMYADEAPSSERTQELYLKGLRVAAYYAEEEEDAARSLELHARFVEHAAGYLHFERVALEAMRLRVQHLQQDCGSRPGEVAELESLAARFPESDRAIYTHLGGLAAAISDDCLSSTELRFWTDRLIEMSLRHLDLPEGRWHLRIAIDRRFFSEIESGDLDAAEVAMLPVVEQLDRFPNDFAAAYANWLHVLENAARAEGDVARADRIQERRRLRESG